MPRPANYCEALENCSYDFNIVCWYKIEEEWIGTDHHTVVINYYLSQS